MADYYELARSNYFKVKDPDAFRAWCEKLYLKPFDEERDGERLYGFLKDDGDVLPNVRYNEETGEDDDIDLYQEMSEHLAPGWVAVVMFNGHEKMCYLSGGAIAVDSDGHYDKVLMSDIYQKAKLAFPPESIVTPCEY